MKTIKTLPDYMSVGLSIPEGADISSAYIDSLYACIGSAYPEGLSLAQHRMLFNAMNRLSAATQAKAESFELEDAEFSFLSGAVRSAKVPAANNKAMVAIYNVFNLEG